MKTIYISGKKYRLYDYFGTYKEAIKIAKYLKKKYKNRYFIIARRGWFTPDYVYYLYTTKVFTL